MGESQSFFKDVLGMLAGLSACSQGNVPAGTWPRFLGMFFLGLASFTSCDYDPFPRKVYKWHSWEKLPWAAMRWGVERREGSRASVELREFSVHKVSAFHT